jgi:hypothetical protein
VRLVDEAGSQATQEPDGGIAISLPPGIQLLLIRQPSIYIYILYTQ